MGVAPGKGIRHQEGLGLGASGQLVSLPRPLPAPHTQGLAVDFGSFQLDQESLHTAWWP